MIQLLPYLIGKIKALNSQSNITVVCIDGPTAAGKTILANNLGDQISKSLNVNVQFFRLDWTLRNRKERQDDLKNLLKNEDKFELEGEVHMELDIFRNFLEKVNQLKYDESYNFNNSCFEINGLYSRDDNGQCIGKNKFDFSKKTVLICEGHYTLRSEYRNLIDLNICLLSDKKELLRRKVNRVKDYRSSKEAIDYFWKIDVPSFSYHLNRFHQEIDLLVDNNNYENPKLLDINKVHEWISPEIIDKQKEGLQSLGKNDYLRIFNRIFSQSNLNQTININQFIKIIEFYKKIDFHIASRLQESINSETLGVKESLINELKNLETDLSLSGNDIKVKSKSSTSLYDVYYRKIPVSYGISIEQLNKKIIYLNYSIFMYKCEISLFWEGGAYDLIFNRPLTSIKDNNEIRVVDFVRIKNKIKTLNKFDSDNNKLKLFTPTDFCLPEFLKDIQYELIYTGREHESASLSEIIKSMLKHNNSMLCHRLSNYSEINFFTKFFNAIGISVLNIGNYLIAINTPSKIIKENYINWTKQWLNTKKDFKLDQAKYDLSVNLELEEAKKLLSSFSKNFFLVDSFLFENTSTNNIEEKIKELKIMLTSPNRSLRKRAFQYIEKDEPSLQLNTKSFLNIYGINSEKVQKESFSLNQIPLFYPTIMAEIYLWMHLRGDKAAVLGANVYDLDFDKSIDIDGILEASIKRKVPVIFQSSFNAIGQYEEENNKKSFGYLRLENGPHKLVNSCIASTLKSVFLEENNLPFYGIGLDHVDSKNDIPSGRANRFIDLALKTGQITHIVLDGSSLFDSASRSLKNLTDAYKKVAKYEISLIEKNPSIFLIDLEYCVGEMNYIGDSNMAMIPTRDEIKLFVDIIQSELSESGNGKYNCRPSLFIGNVGTTHHSNDSLDIDSSITFSWVEYVKRNNFVSAVLHGTTNSEVSILKKSTYGCHKVNVAGDFLKIYVSSLPKRFSDEFRIFSPLSKYNMREISKLKNSLSSNEISLIRNNIFKKTIDLIDNINSPILSNRDKSYFHRFSYKFEEDVVDLILDSYKKKKSITNIKKHDFLKKELFFSASMIEVPFEESFCEIADNLIKEGIKYFHIDVGDGIFISRKFSGLNKLGYLSSLNKDIKIHTHLMVKEPFLKLSNNKSYIDSYIDAGSSSIALHLRSFDSKEELKKAMQYIQDKNCRPGLLIEINNTNLVELWNLIKYLKITWVVIMGVPIGYGGQLFQSSCLKTIKHLRTMSINEGLEEFDIEVDGGLNFNNINLCSDAGANIFSGWSIIKDKSIDLIIKNYKKLIKQL